MRSKDDQLQKRNWIGLISTCHKIIKVWGDNVIIVDHITKQIRYDSFLLYKELGIKAFRRIGININIFILLLCGIGLKKKFI